MSIIIKSKLPLVPIGTSNIVSVIKSLAELNPLVECQNEGNIPTVSQLEPVGHTNILLEAVAEAGDITLSTVIFILTPFILETPAFVGRTVFHAL